MTNPEQSLIRSAAFVLLSRGFTLIELTLSVAVTSILLVAIGSALVLVARALPDEASPADRVIRAGQAMRDIGEDLQVARYLTERSATAVTISLPDRNGDGVPERVRYAWSGTQGDPLTRQYNGGTAYTILDNVHQLNLTYNHKNVTEEYPGPLVESTEQVLSSCDTALDLNNYMVDHSHWIGQYFQPSFPANALRWRITRVLFRAREEDDDGGEHTLVQLRTANRDFKPTSTVLEQRTMFQNDLGEGYSWRQFSFSYVKDLLPGQGLCLVLQHPGAGDPSAEIQYENKGDLGATGRLKTGNTGDSWEYRTDKAMKHFIWGTVSTPGPTQTAVRRHVMSVSMTLQAGDGPASQVGTRVRLLNAPETLSAVWELDFDADPRQVDLGGDGGDWVDWENGLTPAELSGGVWHTPKGYSPDRPGLETRPEHDFRELVTVDVRYRAVITAGWGTAFWINADHSGATGAALCAALFKPDAATQELWIGNRTPSGWNWYDSPYKGIPNDLINLRLVIDPAADTMAVFVDGVHKRTYPYVRGYNGYCSNAAARVYADGNEGEFDYVRIRVGGNNP